MVEAGKLVEGRLVTTVEEGRRGWEGCTVASWGWDSLGDGLERTVSAVNSSVTSQAGTGLEAAPAGCWPFGRTGSDEEMKSAIASIDSIASSSPSRSESSSGRITPGRMGAFFRDVPGDSTDVTVVAVGNLGARLFSLSFNFALAFRLSLSAAIFAFVSASPLAMGLAPGILGGDEIEVGSLTGMILLLAVIFTSFEAGEALVEAGVRLFPPSPASFTGVIISFGGGVLGFGGLMVTFTSIGCCFGWPVISSSCVWSLAGQRTGKPARAVRQDGSDQARSVTATR